MADLHPFFVHFPIALILAAVFFDGYSAIKKHDFSRTTAFVLQGMAAISAILAALTGNQAETRVDSQEKLASSVSQILERHVSLGNAAVWIIVLVVVGRTFAVLEKKEWASSGWVFPGISVVLGILVLITGLVGGELSRLVLQYFVNH